MSRDRVVLIDGSALLYRAFFALPATLRTTSGVPTNATYGFARMFKKILSGRKPALGAVVFDSSQRTFRAERYPEYKQGRPRMPADMRAQLSDIDEVIAAFAFPVLRAPGYEADDVIATLANLAVAAGHEVIVVSSDKDFVQLVGPKVKLMDPMKDVTYDAELVRKKWGVLPERFIDFQALVGDKVDNVPGVAGVGPKSAIELLERFGNLSGVLEHADEIKGKLGESIRSNSQTALLSRELVTLDQAVPLAAMSLADFDELRLGEMEEEHLNSVLLRLEFHSMLSHVASTEKRAEVATVESASQIAAIFQIGEPTVLIPVLSGDDADDPSPLRSEVLGLCLHSAQGSAFVPVSAMRYCSKQLAEAAYPKWTAGLRDLYTVLSRQGLELAGVTCDVLLASYLLDPTAELPHRLDQVARRYLSSALQLPSKWLSERKLPDFSSAESVDRASFFGERARIVFELAPTLVDAMEKGELSRYFNEVDLELSPVLARCERVGIGVDRLGTEELGREFSARRDEVQARIYAKAGKNFNLASPKQLGEVLFEDLKIPSRKKTKTGYSTAADVLEQLAVKHPIVADVLEWRALAKLVNTYTDVLLAAIDSSGRVHCRFGQTVSASGRIITTDPDLQRTPVRTADGSRMRSVFQATAGHRIISADYNQIELRILAHVTRDAELCSAFASGRDVHRQTAARIHDVAESAVTAEMRNVGKTVNFATIYGQGASALGQQLGVSRARAEELIARYFEYYAGVRTWLEQSVALAERLGTVETLMGRRRFVRELSSRDPSERSYGERIAANTPIQGSAADIAKLAMIDIHKALRQRGLAAELVLQIHDEFLIDCPEEEVDEVARLTKSAMENVVELEVPLVVNVGSGKSWAEAKA